MTDVVVAWARPVDTSAMRALLDPQQLDRLQRLRSAGDVRRVVTAHALLRLEVADWMGVTSEEVAFASTCRTCGGGHGKPHVLPVGAETPPHVSLSHSGELVLVALASAGPVGVDVEPCKAASFDGFDTTVLHVLEEAPSAAERTVVWVRKESVLKATGDGITVDPRRLRVSDSRRPPRLLRWEGAGAPREPAWMYDVAVDPEHVACVTVLSSRRPHLIVRAAARAAPPA